VACLVEHKGMEAFDLQGPVASFLGLKAATAEIAALWCKHPSAQLQVLAVTGTNGKTSTAWWLAHALAHYQQGARKGCAMVGTLGIGVPPKVVSERLGHASVAFTMQVYQHILPGMQADAAETFGEIVFGE